MDDQINQDTPQDNQQPFPPQPPPPPRPEPEQAAPVQEKQEPEVPKVQEITEEVPPEKKPSQEVPPPQPQKKKPNIVVFVVPAIIVLIALAVLLGILKPHKLLPFFRGDEDTTPAETMESTISAESIFNGMLNDIDSELEALEEDIDLDVVVDEDLEL